MRFHHCPQSWVQQSHTVQWLYKHKGQYIGLNPEHQTLSPSSRTTHSRTGAAVINSGNADTAETDHIKGCVGSPHAASYRHTYMYAVKHEQLVPPVRKGASRAGDLISRGAAFQPLLLWRFDTLALPTMYHYSVTITSAWYVMAYTCKAIMLVQTCGEVGVNESRCKAVLVGLKHVHCNILGMHFALSGIAYTINILTQLLLAPPCCA